VIFTLLLLQATAIDTGDRQWRDPPDCWDGPQSELTHCAAAEYRAADDELNRQWRVAISVLGRLDEKYPVADNRPIMRGSFDSESRVDALRKSQRAWLTFRDNHCSLPFAEGGSITPMLHFICLRELTEKRTAELASLTRSPVSGEPYFADE
jgi:uncharacterized protein YecT (DUF1311 family)